MVPLNEKNTIDRTRRRSRATKTYLGYQCCSASCESLESRLLLSTVVQPLTIPAPTGSVIAIQSGATESGHLANGQIDEYSFSVKANSGIVATMASTDGKLAPDMTLYGPDGSQIDHNYTYTAGGSTLIRNASTLAGTYYLVVYDSFGAGAGGAYNVAVATAGPQAADPQGGAIASSHTVSGNLNGNLHVYSFSALAHSGIVATMGATDGKVAPDITLFAPNGSQIDHNYTYTAGGSTLIRNASTLAGTYYLVVYDSFGAGAGGAYNISVAYTPGSVSGSSSSDLSALFTQQPPASLAVGATATAAFALSNNGPAEARGTYSASFSLIPINGGSAINGVATASGSIDLASGADSIPILMNISLSSTSVAGTYKLVGTLTDGGGIADSNFSDKTFSTDPIVITPLVGNSPALTLSVFDSTTGLASGSFMIAQQKPLVADLSVHNASGLWMGVTVTGPATPGGGVSGWLAAAAVADPSDQAEITYVGTFHNPGERVTVSLSPLSALAIAANVTDIVATGVGLTSPEDIVGLAQSMQNLPGVRRAFSDLAVFPTTFRGRAAAIYRVARDLRSVVSEGPQINLVASYLRATDPSIAAVTTTKRGLNALKNKLKGVFGVLTCLTLIKKIANEIVYDIQTNGEPITEVFEAEHG